MWHVWGGGTGKVHTGFWWGHLREGDNLQELAVDWRIIVKWICKKWDRGTSSGLLWLRIGRGGTLL